MNAVVRLVSGLGPHDPVSEYIFNVLIPVSVIPGRAMLQSCIFGAFDFCILGRNTERKLDQWHGTVYLHHIDRLRTLSNSNAPLRLIFTVLPITFNRIFVFMC